MATLGDVEAGRWWPVQGYLKEIPIQLTAIHASDGFGGLLGRGKAQPGAASSVAGPPVHGKVHFLNFAVAGKNFSHVSCGHIP